MNIKEIQNLIKFVAKSGAYEVEIEKKDFKITIKTSNSNSRKSATKLESLPVTEEISHDQDIHVIKSKDNKVDVDIENEKYIVIKSPIIGTAYLAAEPGAKKFVEVGDKIKKGQTIMIVEAMKTMNHVPSTSDGLVKQILVNDGQPVEFGQTLIVLK